MRALLFLVAFSLVASFVVVGETAAQGTGAAQPATEFTLVSYQQGSSFYFTLEGQTQRDPTLVVPPNAQITITLKNGGGVHNVQVTGQPASDYVNAEGDVVTYTFTSPASGTLEYWCVPHKRDGMGGRIQVAAAGGDAGAGGGQDGGNGTATPPPPSEYVFNAHDEDGRFWWTVEGIEGRNPTVPIPPSTEITLRVRNAGSTTHNLQVQGATASEYVNAPGDEVVYKFTSPASGSVPYWCVPHKTAGMGGNFRVVVPGEAPAGGGGAEQEEFAGPAVRLGDVLPAAAGTPCADLMIPAAATDRIGGGTPADYLKRCLNPQGDAEEAPGPHAADYVIPLSWALIALGIVGVVWVHRSYKP